MKPAIAMIPETAWTTIEYTDAIFDDSTNTWTSPTEVAEIPFTAFTSRAKKDHTTGHLVLRRIPELNKKDQVHRRHTIIDQVNTDLEHSALAHLPSGTFTANAAWLVLAVLAFNLTRAAGTLTSAALAKATTSTIRRKLVTVPARIVSSGRRTRLHLPDTWPWETARSALFAHALPPPRS